MKQVQLINSMIQNRAPVFAFLMNGIKLQGTISAQDEQHLVLMGSGLNILAFKQSLATIVPQVSQVFVKNMSEDKNETKKDVPIRVIDDLIEHKLEVSVYLMSGIRLVGFIEDHDDEQIVLNYQNNPQVIYKHAIATIMPNVEKPARSYGN